MKIILASQSPRRKEILENLGYGFEVVPSGSDEKIKLEEGIDHAIEELAVEKAKEVRKRFPDDCIVAADTVVVLDGRILGKPASKQDAIDVLVDLSGRAHEVKTGVCISLPNSDISFCETTHVHFRNWKGRRFWIMSVRESAWIKRGLTESRNAISCRKSKDRTRMSLDCRMRKQTGSSGKSSIGKKRRSNPGRSRSFLCFCPFAHRRVKSHDQAGKVKSDKAVEAKISWEAKAGSLS